MWCNRISCALPLPLRCFLSPPARTRCCSVAQHRHRVLCCRQVHGDAALARVEEPLLAGLPAEGAPHGRVSRAPTPLAAASRELRKSAPKDTGPCPDDAEGSIQGVLDGAAGAAGAAVEGARRGAAVLQLEASSAPARPSGTRPDPSSGARKGQTAARSGQRRAVKAGECVVVVAIAGG
jgi:hypothetical protein